MIVVEWGVCTSCTMGVHGQWFLLAFKVQCHWFPLFHGISIKQDFGIQTFDLIITWVPFGMLILRD